MIERLQGTLIQKSPHHILIDCNGIGFGVNIPLSTYEKLPAENSTAALIIYHHVNGSDYRHTLYGFAEPAEKELFNILISVQGVGPKLALAILSGTDVPTFKKAIASEDISLLTKMKGVGKKTAEKLMFELKENFADIEAAASQAGADSAAPVSSEALNALMALGYSKQESAAVLDTPEVKEKNTLENKVKAALLLLRG